MDKMTKEKKPKTKQKNLKIIVYKILHSTTITIRKFFISTF